MTFMEQAQSHQGAPEHASAAELEAALGWVRLSPGDEGRLMLVVSRPAVDERALLEEATLDHGQGLVGDTWSSRPRSSAADPRPSVDRQLTLMNWRIARIVARTDERVPLAGDQLYVDYDLSIDNAPPGTLLRIGDATIELTEPPHTGCAKFVSRFGREAMEFVNSPLGRRLRLRGANAKVVHPGQVHVEDTVRKVT
jgi:hypothetical protein